MPVNPELHHECKESLPGNITVQHSMDSTFKVMSKVPRSISMEVEDPSNIPLPFNRAQGSEGSLQLSTELDNHNEPLAVDDMDAFLADDYLTGPLEASKDTEDDCSTVRLVRTGARLLHTELTTSQWKGDSCASFMDWCADNKKWIEFGVEFGP